MFADELAASLGALDAFAVDCAGDMRLGGSAAVTRRVHVASPFDDSTLHTFELVAGGIATSGIGKRSWLDEHGRPAHHLLDPATGRPAFTGVVQATALAPTAAKAEVLSKAAVLSGPAAAQRILAAGGALVTDDGSLPGPRSCRPVVHDYSSATARPPRHYSSATARPPRHCSSAHGTTTASSCGESRATTYSAGSVSETFSSTWVSRGGT